MNRATHRADEGFRAEHDPAHLVGRVVGGKYRIERILGRGGMGTIYVAVQEPLGRRVALKVLHPNLGEGSDPEFQKRFLLEAATLSQLAHPNIVVVHDYGSLEGRGDACFMAMELLEGRTINQVLNEQGRFEPARALRITRDIARALRAAHDLGVIHRDLKPANVMLCSGPEGETVKVLDFGLVKVLRDDSEELTQEGRFLGSPRYMSPEQIQRSPMDGRSDLYSLGVILYRMLTGEVPFAGEHAVQTLMAHLSKPVPPLAQHGVHVPSAVEQMVMQLLAKDPNDRPRDAGALIRSIDTIWPQLSAEPLLTSGEYARDESFTPAEEPEPRTIVEAAPSGAVPLPPPAKTSRPLLPAAIALGLVIAVGAGVGVALLLAKGGDEQVVGSSLDERPAPIPVPVLEPPRPEPPAPAAVTPESAPPRTFTLTIRSIPEGATVEQDGEVVGETPLTLELDAEVLGIAPASFVLRKEGRAPVRFEQGASEGNVEIERVLPPRRVRRTSRTETPVGGGSPIKTSR